MIEQQGNICRLGGDLTLETVPDLLEKIRPLIRAGVEGIDCSAIENVDSAALGLLLASKREAQARQKGLKLMGLPDSLSSLAALYGITDQL